MWNAKSMSDATPPAVTTFPSFTMRAFSKAAPTSVSSWSIEKIDKAHPTFNLRSFRLDGRPKFAIEP
jgi:hypothetical protein